MRSTVTKDTDTDSLELDPTKNRSMRAAALRRLLAERHHVMAFGLGGVLTPTGVGTVVEKGKQRIEVEGKPYLLETALRPDFALVQAFVADYTGNLHYALTARNFNPVIAMAATTVVVDAEPVEIVLHPPRRPVPQPPLPRARSASRRPARPCSCP